MQLLSKVENKGLKQLIVLTMISTFSACDGTNHDDPSTTADTNNRIELKQIVQQQGLTGNAASGRVLPSINDPIAQLGKKLFFSKALSGDQDTACVTCHHPMLGGGDNLSLSIGVGSEVADLLGRGRTHSPSAMHFDGGPTVPRNAPTTFNIGLWDKFMFHDGRVESLGKTSGVNGGDGLGIDTPDSLLGEADAKAGANLVEAQARFPVTSQEEMRGFVFAAEHSNHDVRSALEKRLSEIGYWDDEFIAAFGDANITFARIAQALADYERSQVFVASPFKAFVEGDDTALSPAAVRGALFFFKDQDQGGANCASCHAGDFFTDEEHHVTASPQIGRGKGSNNGITQNADFGRFMITNEQADMYCFRTPSLLNVEVTGPWGHAGGHATLSAAVRHSLHPAKAIANYDFSQLDGTIQVSDMLTNTQFALDQLAYLQANSESKVMQNIAFTEQNVADLVEFLHALTDPCVKDRECLAPWISSASEVDPDGMRLNAIDEFGTEL